MTEVEVAFRSGKLAASAYGDPNAPAVALVHGMALDSRVWDTVARRLDDFFVVTIDLPGFGNSSPVSTSPFHSCADAIAEILDQLDVGSTAVVGHSMGGYISCDFAYRYAARVRSLALIATTAATDTSARAEQRLAHAKAIEHGDLETYIRHQLTMAPKCNEMIRENVSPRIAALLREIATRHDLVDELHSRAISMLVASDDEQFLEPMQALDQRWPNSHLTIHPAGGHMIICEQPEFVASWIKASAT